MEELHSIASISPDLADSLTFADQEVLERAIGKLVLLGKQVGVGPDEMIVLLESGMTVIELVEHLAALDAQRC